MPMNNWIKWSRSWRGSFDKNPEKDARLSAVYLYLVLEANWNDSDGLKAGQLSVSIPKVAKDVAMFSLEETRALVDRLEKIGLITLSRASKWRASGYVATITDYEAKFGHNSTHDLNHPYKTHEKPMNSIPETLENVDGSQYKTHEKPITVSKEVKKKRKKTNTLSLAVAEEDLSWIDIATEWNIRLPNHSQVRIPILRKNDKRKSDIRKAIEKHTSEIILEAINKIYSSEFLCGKNDRHWKPDLDWIIKTENIQKVLEGKYEDKNKPIPKDRYLK